MNDSGIKLRGHSNGSVTSRLALALFLGHLAVTSSFAAGSVAAWGYNSAGQTVVPSSALADVIAIAGGGNHSLALKSDGSVVAWGWNSAGQTNVPFGLAPATAIAAGGLHSLALLADGTVAVWGSQPQPPAGLSGVVAIAAGASHSLALKSDGRVVGWGDNSYNETDVPASVSNAVAIAAGSHFSVALCSNGTLVAWGEGSWNKTSVPSSAVNVIAIAAGADHVLALKRDGSLVAWGRSTEGQTTIPAKATNVVAIAAGAKHSLVAKADGTLVGFGDNTYTQSTVGGGGAFYYNVAAGDYHSLTLRGDGSPVFVMQPVPQVVPFGQTATFQLLAAGYQPMSIQWRKDGVPLANSGNFSGVTTSTLRLTNVQMTDGASFTAAISNALGVAVSVPALLTPVGVPPWFTSQSKDQSALCGTNVTLVAVADGPKPFGYQWYFNGSEIPGATGSSLVRPNVSSADAGPYVSVTTNIYGATTSAVVNLTIIGDPWITTQPQPLSVNCGASPTLTVGADGPKPLSYQWQFEDVPLAGATRSSLTLPGIIGNQAGNYNVVVTSPCGAITSASALLTIAGIPVLTSQPRDTNAYCGRDASLSVVGSATGPGPLSYQWMFGDLPLPGATTATLLLTNITTAVSGPYSAVVACPCGSITSSVARLTVIAEPAIVTQPQSASVFCSEGVTFQVTASGPTPLSYQWMLQGTNLPGASTEDVSDPIRDDERCGHLYGVGGLSVRAYLQPAGHPDRDTGTAYHHQFAGGFRHTG